MEVKRRGRPPINGQAMTQKERNELRVKRRDEEGKKRVDIILSKKEVEILDKFCNITGASRVAILSGIAENAITEWAVDVESRFDELEEKFKELRANRERKQCN